LALRNDKRALWENFLMSERLKKNSYTKHFCNTYFWRTFDQAEVNYIEEYDGTLNLFEFKWKANNIKIPASLLQSYPINSSKMIDTSNYDQFIG
jgi:hypothetical protein